MIVRDEEKTLVRCLESIHDIVDEIVIVDTGSKDKTETIAFKYTNKVYNFQWIDDFSTARNYAFSKATKDYIMWLDADDVILEEDRLKLKKLKDNLDYSFDVVMMKYNLFSREDNKLKCTFMRERLLKRIKGFSWHDPIHEYIIISGKILNTDICITHKRMHGKTDRNLKIFKKMIAEGKKLSDRNKFYYARELFLNGEINDAVICYNQFLDTSGGLSSNYMDASMDLAGCYRILNDDSNVLKALLRSFEHGSPRAEICCHLGFYYKEKKDYRNAIFWYKTATDIQKPSNEWGSYLHNFYDFVPNMELSSCYYHIGDVDMAIRYNDIAFTFNPDDPMVKQNIEFLNSIKKNNLELRKKRVLIGSPVYQKEKILDAFLHSLGMITEKTISIDYIFVDDNADEKSSELLIKFKEEKNNVVILDGEKREESLYNDEDTHKWTDNIALKVAEFKNQIIEYAIKEKYDYLFLIDSDIVIHPYLIEHLKSKQKKIISEIFWTQWHVDEGYAPNVWLYDQYSLAPRKHGETLTKEEIISGSKEFLTKLLVPGVYEVGGLGACTLIDIEALNSGVNFKPIKNLTIQGEDRFFCIRAIVLGFELFVDTNYPTYHIYRENLLNGVSNYINNCQTPNNLIRKYKERNNKLTLSMVVKNESSRYLEEVLSKLKNIIDNAVIIDDASDDNTIEIIEKALNGIPIKIIKNEKSMFANEVELRKKQWDETIKTNPDWILNIDADEIFEDIFYENITKLINEGSIDVYLFRLYDMWDENNYREDQFWNSHNHYKPFLLRYQPEFKYDWVEKKQHCGRFPSNILLLPKATPDFRVKHYGWARLNDRITKYERYKKLDPNAVFGDKNQYESILDEKPNLIEWKN